MKIKRNIMWLFCREKTYIELLRLFEKGHKASIERLSKKLKRDFPDIKNLSLKACAKDLINIYSSEQLIGTIKTTFTKEMPTSNAVALEFNTDVEFKNLFSLLIEEQYDDKTNLLDEHANPLCKLLKNYCEDTSGNFLIREEHAEEFLSRLREKYQFFQLLICNSMRGFTPILRLSHHDDKYHFHFSKDKFFIFLKGEKIAEHKFNNDYELIKHLKLYCYGGGYFHE